MSLLLDALKHAENLKRGSSSGGGSTVRPALDSSASEAPDLLSLAEEPVRITPAAPARTAPLPAQPAGSRGQAEISRLPRARSRNPGRKSRLPLVGLLLGVAVLLAGTYWYVSPAAAPVKLMAPAMPAPAPVAAVEPIGVITTYTLAPAAADPQPARQPAANAGSAIQPAATAPAMASVSPAPAPQQPAAVVVSARPSPLLAAYAAFRAGDLSRAEVLYRETLTGEPRQPDAHLGLAVIAQARGDGRSAMSHYRNVVEVTPDHPRAWAGIADLASDRELEQMESRLRGLIASRPTASLHFALGNILMRQARWPEAQESYFAASAAAPESAEYAFNLAVALDHIGKGQVAIHHYEQAIALAAGSSAVQFDVQAARQRLATLQRGTL